MLMLCVCVCTTALANAVVQPAQQGIVRRGRTAAIEAHAAMRLLDTLDVGHMMKLEHINLGVGNKDTARIFYADGLGCTEDHTIPERLRNDTVWMNLGGQQFHLQLEGSYHGPPHVVSGCLGLVIPSLRALVHRLEAVQNLLTDTLFSWTHNQDGEMDDHVEVVDPWGNFFMCYEQSTFWQVSGRPGIKYVAFYCAPGTSKDIRCGRSLRTHRMQPSTMYGVLSQFYAEQFSTPTIHTRRASVDDPLTCGGDEDTVIDNRVRLWSLPPADSTIVDGQPFCKAIVAVGGGIYLVFVEPTAEDADAATYDEWMRRQKGIHVAVYTTHFTTIHDAMKTKGLVWTNPRFTHIDTCDTHREVTKFKQFRFRYIPTSASSGSYELEHETRSPCHQSFLRLIPYVPR